MDKKIITIVKKYAELVKKTILVEKIILYGSYAGGNPKKYSDIDIAVISDKIKGDYLEVSAHLFDLVRQVDSRIEPVLFAGTKDKSGFLENILKTGKIIYQNNQ